MAEIPTEFWATIVGAVLTLVATLIYDAARKFFKMDKKGALQSYELKNLKDDICNEFKEVNNRLDALSSEVQAHLVQASAESNELVNHGRRLDQLEEKIRDV